MLKNCRLTYWKGKVNSKWFCVLPHSPVPTLLGDNSAQNNACIQQGGDQGQCLSSRWWTRCSLLLFLCFSLLLLSWVCQWPPDFPLDVLRISSVGFQQRWKLRGKAATENSRVKTRNQELEKSLRTPIHSFIHSFDNNLIVAIRAGTYWVLILHYIIQFSPWSCEVVLLITVSTDKKTKAQCSEATLPKSHM